MIPVKRPLLRPLFDAVKLIVIPILQTTFVFLCLLSYIIYTSQQKIIIRGFIFQLLFICIIYMHYLHDNNLKISMYNIYHNSTSSRDKADNNRTRSNIRHPYWLIWISRRMSVKEWTRVDRGICR